MAKQVNGLGWGWHIMRADARDDAVTATNYQPINDIQNTDGSVHLVKRGNEWGYRDFQHPDLLKHTNWHYWDNPEVPQLLWQHPANPNGTKQWVRMVPGEILTSTPTTNGAARINILLEKLSDGKIDAWHQIAPIRDWKNNKRKHVLFVTSSHPVYTNYYGTTIDAWLSHYTRAVEGMGYTWEVREKPNRKERRDGGQLTDQLNNGDYSCVVCQHSVAAQESIMAGVPAVVTGPVQQGPLATPWEEFAMGELRKPEMIEVVNWTEALLGNTYHISEISEPGWRIKHGQTVQ